MGFGFEFWFVFFFLLLQKCLNDSASGLALVCSPVNPPYSFSGVFQGLTIFPVLPLGNQKRGRWERWTSSHVFYFQNWRVLCSFCTSCSFLLVLVFAVRMMCTRKNGVQCFVLISTLRGANWNCAVHFQEVTVIYHSSLDHKFFEAKGYLFGVCTASRIMRQRL